MDKSRVLDAIIIGGGASGLTVANIALLRGKSFVLLEASKRVGRKILLAGNGKCNISNRTVTADNYNNPYVAGFLSDSGKVDEFFKAVGIVTKSVDGRVYPYTESGNTVLNLLRSKISDNIVVDEKVEKISFKDGVFRVGCFEGKKVIICTGGITSGGMGSYSLLEDFGHKKTKLYPVLVPLKTDTADIKGLSGIRVKAKLTLKSNNYSESGELLFKDNGLSGIVSMSISRFLKGNDDEISIDFAPEFTVEELKKLNLEGVLVRTLLTAVEKQASYRRQSVEKTIKDFVVKNVRAGDIAVAQVTRGGIDTKDFDKNLQSKLRQGLYACGEVLDVDGACGGYNLHWAFLSGIIVGENL